MKVYVNHDYKYEVGNLIKAFGFQPDFVDHIADAECINTHLVKGDDIHVQCTLETDIEEVLPVKGLTSLEKKRQLKHFNNRVLYQALRDKTHKILPWGTLVGVRPAKIVHQLIREGKSGTDIEAYLQDYHQITKEKVDLIMKVAKAEQPFLEDVYDHPISLYISVPFCPSQCLYCSFPSNSMAQKGHLIEEYLKVLKREIEAAYQGVVDNKRTLDCLYIGGGTPTSLTADQFEMLLSLLDQYFDLKTLKEFTIEAGRPKTISKEKLQVFKKYNVSRICLNPQTMNERTLKHIGRYHSVEDIHETYALIKSFDFKTINMDLILGLPGEKREDVERTIESVLALDPENITVHTLAIKRSSALKQSLDQYALASGDEIKDMVEDVGGLLEKNNYHPYYLYRQKNMAGNFENVGYTKPGHISCYNVRIIEEQHSILALGPGAVSKKCVPEESFFERIATIKGLEQYLDRQDEVVDRVKAFFT